MNEKNSFEWGEELPTLESSRLALTQLTPKDAPQILTIFGDPEVIRFWGTPLLADLEGAKEFINEVHKNFKDKELFGWGIRWHKTGEIIGTSTLLHMDRSNQRAEIGFAVAHDFWGQGIATEAIETLIGFAFNTLKLHRLEADVDPDNIASLRVLEKQGFVREGLLRERWHQADGIRDTVFLGLLKREWKRGVRDGGSE